MSDQLFPGGSAFLVPFAIVATVVFAIVRRLKDRAPAAGPTSGRQDREGPGRRRRAEVGRPASDLAGRASDVEARACVPAGRGTRMSGA